MGQMRRCYILLFVLMVVFLSGCAAGRKARTRKVEALISTARSYTGTPYRFGGMSRAGMDCSGLLYQSFRAVGLTLPRTSKQQSKYGKKVRIDQLRPGDMVFFGSERRRRRVSHAGIVTSVRGRQSVKFIHASTSLGVVESELYTDYYQRIFVRGRRVKLK